MGPEETLAQLRLKGLVSGDCNLIGARWETNGISYKKLFYILNFNYIFHFYIESCFVFFWYLSHGSRTFLQILPQVGVRIAISRKLPTEFLAVVSPASRA